MSTKTDYRNIVKVVLVLASITAAFFKIFYGWDQDESYIILLIDRILKGDILYRDIWDLHQNCAVLPAFFMIIYSQFFGTAGMAVFLRIAAQLIILLASIIVYCFVKRSYNSDTAFFSALVVVNMLPRATLQLEYGLCTVLFSIISSILLLDVWKRGGDHGFLQVFISGLFYGMSVFVYPTMVISVPLYFYICFFRLDPDYKKGIKYSIAFWGACALLAAVFFAYIFHYLTPLEFIRVIREFGKSADHTTLFPAFQNSGIILKSLRRFIVYLAVSSALWFLAGKKINVFYIYIFISFISIVVPNISGFRPSGPFGMLERYIVLAFLSFFVIRKVKDKPVFWVLFMGGVSYYLGSLMGSNLGFNENAMYLEMSIVAGVISGVQDAGSYKEESIKLFSWTAICFLLLELIFSKGFFVRVNRTEPANITQCASVLEEGPFYGIRVKELQKTELDSHIDTVKCESDKEQLYLYLGNDPVYNFFFEGEVTSAQYAGTAMPNDQFIDYYFNFHHKLPGYLFVDKHTYPLYDDLLNNSFPKYLEENGYFGDIKDTGDFYIIRIISPLKSN